MESRESNSTVSFKCNYLLLCFCVINYLLLCFCVIDYLLLCFCVIDYLLLCFCVINYLLLCFCVIDYLLLCFCVINYLLLCFCVINYLLLCFCVIDYLLLRFCVINYLLLCFCVINYLLLCFCVIDYLLLCFLLSPGLITIAGLVVYIVFYGKVITHSSDVSGDSFPWSVLMVFLAAILFIIINILIRLRCRNRNHLQHAIPTSADSKMALNPSTKSQVMKRYFTPSPYREDRREAISNTPSTSNTEQGRVVRTGLQSNNFGPQIVEHIQTNGNLQTQSRYEQEAITSNVIQTHHMRPGVSTAPAPSGYSYTHQKTFNTDFITSTADDRSQKRQEMVIYQQPQKQQLQQVYYQQHHQQQPQQQQQLQEIQSITTRINRDHFQQQIPPPQQQQQLQEIQSVTTRFNHDHFQHQMPPPQQQQQLQSVNTRFNHDQFQHQIPQPQQQQQQLQKIQTVTTRMNRENVQAPTLDDTQIDNMESETIFYKGGGDITVKNLSFVQGVTTDQGQRDGLGYSWERRDYTNGGFATEDIGGRDEQVTAFHATEFLASARPHEVRLASIDSFRVGAEHQDVEPFRQLPTTHMRRANQRNGRVLSGASLTSGKGHQYNSKFMYRPYTEQSY